MNRPGHPLRVAARVLVCLGLNGIAMAAGAREPDEELPGYRSSEAESLLTVIRFLESDIATKSVVQYTDDAPGLVEVFRREDLEARGVRTVAEALRQVTAIDVPVDSLGVRQPVIRGFGGILSGATGKLKYLLNGVSMNSTQSATGSGFLEIPIGQIERIEIIRGPGSAVYGENAFLGVVNVVTGSSGRDAFVRLGSNHSVTGGARWSHTSDGGVNFNLNVAGSSSDGPRVSVDSDPLFPIGQAAVSNAPGTTNETRDSASAVLGINQGGFSFSLQYVEAAQGDFFGALFLPPAEDRDVITNRWWTAEASQRFAPTPEREIRLKAGWQDFRNRFDDVQISPPGFLGIYPAGQVATTNYEEERLYGGLELVDRTFANQTWLLGVEYARTRNEDTYSDQNFDTSNLIPGTPFPAPLPEKRRFSTILDDDQTRRVASLYLQDHIDSPGPFAFTAGVRVDSYSDAGDAVTPRLAGVYHLNEQNILKAQYAEAFRPPTFVELYSTADAARGDRDLEPETVRTTELTYIRKTASSLFSATVYHSDFEDLIVSRNRQFVNARGATARGLDLEVERRVTERLKLALDVAFADTEDDDTGLPLEGSSDWIANARLFYRPLADWLVHVYFRFVDDRYRSATDTRDVLEDYSVAGFTASRFNLGYENLTLRFGVDNLFDEDVTDPAPENTYADDFPRGGRTYFVQLSVRL